MARKTITDEYIKDLCEKEDYTFLRSFKEEKIYNGKIKRINYLEVIHNRCGKRYIVRKDKFITEGQRCSCLRKENNLGIVTNDDFKSFLLRKYGGEYSDCREYIGMHKPVYITHKCGYEYRVPRAEMMVFQEMRCPICSHNKVRTLKETELYLQNKGYDMTILDDENAFNSSSKKPMNILVRNNKCSHEYTICLNDYICDESAHRPCPICNPSYGCSSYELTLINDLKDLYSGEIIHKFRMNNIEIDIYFPDKKLGIEIDGLYWHSNEIKKDPKYQLNKKMFFLENGINTIHFFEDEVIYKYDIVLDKISSMLGINRDKIYARKTVVEKLSYAEKEDFFNRNHIQGNDTSPIAYGLYYGDELVAAMSFKKSVSRAKNNFTGTYELSRYATKLGSSIVGGFSKLLKHIQKHEGFSEIISFGDIRMVDPRSNVYLNNGFVEDHKTRISYYYVRGTRRFSKYSFRKSEQKKKFSNYDPNMTEYDNMRINGYRIIYDSGLILYKLK